MNKNKMICLFFIFISTFLYSQNRVIYVFNLYIDSTNDENKKIANDIKSNLLLLLSKSDISSTIQIKDLQIDLDKKDIENSFNIRNYKIDLSSYNLNDLNSPFSYFMIGNMLLEQKDENDKKAIVYLKVINWVSNKEFYVNYSFGSLLNIDSESKIVSDKIIDNFIH
jgi:hypothetical protein